MSSYDDDDNGDLNEAEYGERALWRPVAESDNRTEAEFAVNGLKSYDIPAVLDASPGVLGTAGLKMRSIYSGRVTTFRVLVPADFEEEAKEIVKIFIRTPGVVDVEDLDDVEDIDDIDDDDVDDLVDDDLVLDDEEDDFDDDIDVEDDDEEDK